MKREAGDEEKKKRNGKSSVSTKRSRAAAIHNQSERVCIFLSDKTLTNNYASTYLGKLK